MQESLQVCASLPSRTRLSAGCGHAWSTTPRWCELMLAHRTSASPELLFWQEEDVHFERDASGNFKELGTGAFGKVRLGRASKHVSIAVWHRMTA